MRAKRAGTEKPPMSIVQYGTPEREKPSPEEICFRNAVQVEVTSPDHEAAAHPVGLSESTYAQVREGDSAARVMERLGAPDWSRPLGCDGLELGYLFERDRFTFRAHLEFDRQQRLVRRLEKLAP